MGHLAFMMAFGARARLTVNLLSDIFNRDTLAPGASTEIIARSFAMPQRVTSQSELPIYRVISWF